MGPRFAHHRRGYFRGGYHRGRYFKPGHYPFGYWAGGLLLGTYFAPGYYPETLEAVEEVEVPAPVVAAPIVPAPPPESLTEEEMNVALKWIEFRNNNPAEFAQIAESDEAIRSLVERADAELAGP